MNLEIVPLTPQNVEQVARLEALCFPDPWSLDSFCSELSNPFALYRVALWQGEFAGYAGMHQVLDEGHVTNVAVAPALRGRGIARALMESLLARCKEEELAFLTLEVRPSNAGAIALYRGLGFEEVGRRKGYYRHPPEDALLMTRFFPGAPTQGLPV